MRSAADDIIITVGEDANLLSFNGGNPTDPNDPSGFEAMGFKDSREIQDVLDFVRESMQEIYDQAPRNLADLSPKEIPLYNINNLRSGHSVKGSTLYNRRVGRGLIQRNPDGSGTLELVRPKPFAGICVNVQPGDLQNEKRRKVISQSVKHEAGHILTPAFTSCKPLAEAIAARIEEQYAQESEEMSQRFRIRNNMCYASSGLRPASDWTYVQECSSELAALYSTTPTTFASTPIEIVWDIAQSITEKMYATDQFPRYAEISEVIEHLARDTSTEILNSIPLRTLENGRHQVIIQNSPSEVTCYTFDVESNPHFGFEGDNMVSITNAPRQIRTGLEIYTEGNDTPAHVLRDSFDVEANACLAFDIFKEAGESLLTHQKQEAQKKGKMGRRKRKKGRAVKLSRISMLKVLTGKFKVPLTASV
ncbi:MAG: hypothetical protein KC680_04425 [Candidatus Peregrinibacteria bacterium]|nr:hypothetical protein [Candidatus Peregrinibacteria bacterium]MCB9808427.1 hypothetical protein [Candidatus Peribacteria bacterium]